MAVFHLEVVTPDATVYKGDVSSVTAPAEDGRIGVLSGHAPLCCTIAVGEVLVREATGGERRFLVGDGFLEVARNTCRILAAVGEAAEEIDVARAEAAEKRARERLRAKRDVTFDLARAEVALAKALVRVKLGRENVRRKAR